MRLQLLQVLGKPLSSLVNVTACLLVVQANFVKGRTQHAAVEVCAWVHNWQGSDMMTIAHR